MIKSKIIITIFAFTLIGCGKNPKKTYYPNGNVESTYHEKNGEFDDKFESFYLSGNPKEIHYYEEGIKVDSSIYRYDKLGAVGLKSKVFWDDSVSHIITYDNKGSKYSEGGFKKDNIYYRLGLWSFYDKDMDSVVEYKTINNEVYTNQIFIIDSKKDTVPGRGNYFKFQLPKTAEVNKPFRIKFFLESPYQSVNSDIEVILPIKDSELLEDFSNIYKVESDVFLSLKNDGISNQTIPKSVPINHIVEFALNYSTVGEKRIRGALIEYSDFKTSELKDSVERVERILYFNKTISIIDSNLE
jgi:antitoxin component YwqK of YwqJK toxin-antitoxin module